MSNSFAARRIQGPGLSHAYYYKISTQEAILLVQKEYLEPLQLKCFENSHNRSIRAPLELYNRFISAIVSPFCFTINPKNKTLQQQTSDLSKMLQLQLKKRNKERQNTRIKLRNRHRIRLDATNLAETLRIVTALLRNFVQAKIFIYLSKEEIKEFWLAKELVQNKWESLARKVLAEIFSEGILVPLNDDDDSIRLQLTKNSEEELKVFLSQLTADTLHHGELTSATDTATFHSNTLMYIHTKNVIDQVQTKWRLADYLDRIALTTGLRCQSAAQCSLRNECSNAILGWSNLLSYK